MCTHKRADKDNEAGGHIDSELKENESLDILIERTSPHDGIDDGAKRIVDNRDVACFFSHTRAVAHGEPHMSSFQSRSIIGAIASNGHYLSALLQSFNQSLLIHRAGAGNDFQFPYSLYQLLIAESGKLWTCDESLRGIGIGADSHLSAYLARCAESVARHYLHANAGVEAATNGGGHFGANGIGDGHIALKGAGKHGCIGRGECTAVAKSREFGFSSLLGGESEIYKAECAESALLIREESFKNFLLAGFIELGTEMEEDFGSSFQIDMPLSVNGGLDEGGHIFALSGKGNLIDDSCRRAQGFIVVVLLREPEQERAFGGIAEHFDMLVISIIERSSGIDSEGFGKTHFGQHLGMSHAHTVLSERSGFVGTNHSGGSHRFASVEMAHEVVGLEQAAHTIGQAQCDGHG